MLISLNNFPWTFFIILNNFFNILHALVSIFVPVPMQKYANTSRKKVKTCDKKKKLSLVRTSWPFRRRIIHKPAIRKTIRESPQIYIYIYTYMYVCIYTSIVVPWQLYYKKKFIVYGPIFFLQIFNFFIYGPIAQLITCSVSCRTAFKWCEFDPRHVQQLFGTPFSMVSLRQLICQKSFQ